MTASSLAGGQLDGGTPVNAPAKKTAKLPAVVPARSGAVPTGSPPLSDGSFHLFRSLPRYLGESISLLAVSQTFFLDEICPSPRWEMGLNSTISKEILYCPS